MNNKELIEKYDKGDYLSEDEIKQLLWESHEVEEIPGDNHRWQQEVSTIIEVDNRFFRIDWMRGLTEYQEHDYPEQPYEVVKKQKQIIVNEWVLKKLPKIEDKKDE